MKLYESQMNYLKRLGNRPFIFAEVGTGKTAMALYRAQHSGTKKCLVVCPASVRDSEQWEQEVENFKLTFEDFQVKGFSFLQRAKKQELQAYADYYVIIDEAHKIKNDQSKQGKGAYELCRSTKYGYSLLSGTPMSKWADAVNYGKITGFVRNKTHFYNLFVITQKYKGYPEIVGYRDEKVLRSWWQSIALRLRAEECIELPSRQDISIKIPIKLAKYREMRRTSMRDDEVLDSPSKMCWALRQYAEQSAEKINWVVEKVEGLENALIFANTTEAINKLSQALRKAGIKHGLWTGKKHDDFAKNDVMIVQYQAGGTGLNLQKFNTTIFLSPCYSFNDFTQAIGRTHRNGQKKKCVFYMLEAKGTIDEDIYRVLEKRQDFDDRLINI